MGGGGQSSLIEKSYKLLLLKRSLLPSLLNTLQAIEDSNNDPEHFDEHWRNTSFLEYVTSENTDDGDIIIKVKLVSELSEMNFFPIQ